MLRYITLYLSWFVFYLEWKSVRLELLTSIYIYINYSFRRMTIYFSCAVSSWLRVCLTSKFCVNFEKNRCFLDALVLVFALVSIERGIGQDKYFHGWYIIINLHTHKVSNLSKTSLYTHWAEKHIETDRLQHNSSNSRKIVYFVMSLWRHWECLVILNTHS